MSNTIKKLAELLESIETEYSEEEQEQINEAGEEEMLAAAASELEAISERMSELLNEADELMRSLKSNPAAGRIVTRAEHYWLPQLKGIISPSYFSTSPTTMVSMEDTINELKEASDVDDYEDEY